MKISRVRICKKIPDKMYFKISEASDIIGVEPYVLRFWEKEFHHAAPKRKSKFNHRLYTKSDLKKFLMIKDLLYNQKFTIEGARDRIQILKTVFSHDNNPKIMPEVISFKNIFSESRA